MQLKIILGSWSTDFQFLKLTYIVIDIAVLIKKSTLNSELPLMGVVFLWGYFC